MIHEIEIKIDLVIVIEGNSDNDRDYVDTYIKYRLQ